MKEPYFVTISNDGKAPIRVVARDQQGVETTIALIDPGFTLARVEVAAGIVVSIEVAP